MILCADCDCNRILDASSGRLACANCGSKNWMFVTVPIIAKFRGYSEREAQERAAVDRYINWLEKEEFFASRDALL